MQGGYLPHLLNEDKNKRVMMVLNCSPEYNFIKIDIDFEKTM